MRENRLYGSEGGEAKAFPTPILMRAPLGLGESGDNFGYIVNYVYKSSLLIAVILIFSK